MIDNTVNSIYSKDIKKYNILSQEDEDKIIKNIDNESNKTRLVTSNLKLVLRIAMNYMNKGLDLNELISEGNKGLVIALNRFNPKFNNKFSTYAYFWIKQCIISAINENKKWNCLSEQNVLNYENVDEGILKDDSYYIYDESKKDDRLKDILMLLDSLPERDSLIVKHYFGVNGMEPLNTIELSEKFNISAMRISNIIENSIRKIRCDIFQKMNDI